MSDLIQKFEDDCRASDIDPRDAVAAGGLHRNNWYRWKAGTVSPSVKNLNAAHEGLVRLKATKAQPA